MMRVIEFNSRKLVLQDLCFSQRTAALLSSEVFLALLPAYSEKEGELAAQIAKQLIGLGCVEVCVVGDCSSQLHDLLDSFLEDREEFSTVTTSFVDEMEASEYFIFAADGAEAKLLIALVGEHRGVMDHLLQMTAE